MDTLFGSKDRDYVVDFRKPRVKITTKFLNGGTERNETMSKFSMGYLIERNGDYYFGIAVTIMDAYKYDEVKSRMIELLEQKNFNNVVILK